MATARRWLWSWWSIFISLAIKYIPWHPSSDLGKYCRPHHRLKSPSLSVSLTASRRHRRRGGAKGLASTVLLSREGDRQEKQGAERPVTPLCNSPPLPGESQGPSPWWNNLPFPSPKFWKYCKGVKVAWSYSEIFLDAKLREDNKAMQEDFSLSGNYLVRSRCAPVLGYSLESAKVPVLQRRKEWVTQKQLFNWPATY